MPMPFGRALDIKRRFEPRIAERHHRLAKAGGYLPPIFQLTGGTKGLDQREGLGRRLRKN